MKSEMFPVTPVQDMLNAASRYVESFSERSLRSISFRVNSSNLTNLVFGKSCRPNRYSLFNALGMCVRFMPLVRSSPGPSLSDTINIIVSVGSEEKMSRPYAWLVIALVKNVQSIWNFRIVNGPGNSWSSPSPTSKMERPVSILSDTAGPNPARPQRFNNDWSVLIYLTPKPLKFDFGIIGKKMAQGQAHLSPSERTT